MLLNYKEVSSYFMITFIVDSNSLLWCNLLASLVVKAPRQRVVTSSSERHHFRVQRTESMANREREPSSGPRE